jgi:hypothetical protein
LEGESAGRTEAMREGAPDLPGFLARGSLVSARTGNDLAGYVCDRDAGGDPTGYEFLPWSSIERVSTEG